MTREDWEAGAGLVLCLLLLTLFWHAARWMIGP